MVLSEERTMNRGCKPGSKERGLGFCFFLWTVLGLSCELQAQLPHSMWDLPSATRDQTCVHHIGRQILNCWTTRDSPRISFKVRFPSVKHPLQMKTFYFFKYGIVLWRRQSRGTLFLCPKQKLQTEKVLNSQSKILTEECH